MAIKLSAPTQITVQLVDSEGGQHKLLLVLDQATGAGSVALDARTGFFTAATKYTAEPDGFVDLALEFDLLVVALQLFVQVIANPVPKVKLVVVTGGFADEEDYSLSVADSERLLSWITSLSISPGTMADRYRTKS